MKPEWLTALFTGLLLIVAWLQLRSLRHQVRADFLYRIYKDLVGWLEQHKEVRGWVFEGSPPGILAEKYDEWKVDDFLGFFEMVWSFDKRRLVDKEIVYDLLSDFLIDPYEANNFELQRLISKIRTEEGRPDLYEGVESLYIDLKARMPKKPSKRRKHRAFPGRLAFLLNSPIRRYFNPPSRLVGMLGIKASEVVLDFGCGPGFYTIEIAKRARKTIGVDISAAMLEKARRAATEAAVQAEFLLSDGESVQLENDSVDLILLSHVFHEVERKDRVLGEFRRILREGGRVAMLERTRTGRLGRLLVSPPVLRVSEITEAAAKADLLPTTIEALGDRSLFILTKLG